MSAIAISYAPVYVVVEQANSLDAKSRIATGDIESALRQFADSKTRGDVALYVSTGLKAECLLRSDGGQLSLSGALAAVRA